MARRFLRTTAHRLHLPERELLPEDEQALLAYDFPGNVRELQNIIERAVVLTNRAELGLGLALGRASQPPPPPPITGEGDAGEVLPEAEFRDFERKNLLNALRRCDYRIAGDRGAARLLGLSPSTLAYRMKQLGLERPR
jgi:transcriptional regulator with GAF, ATPase, and Fis domain